MAVKFPSVDNFLDFKYYSSVIDLRKTLTEAHLTLDDEGISHALIGGFALAVYGQHRATMDIDFLADGTKNNIIKSSLERKGFVLKYESAEVLQFSGIGFLDILLANRPLDIQRLLKLPLLNLDLIKKYADLFNEWTEIEKLKGIS